MNSLNPSTLEVGKYFSYQILHNTRHLLFTLSRYKFTARMLARKPKLSVLELGCSEGLGSLILAEEALNVTAIDFDESCIQWAQSHLEDKNIKFLADDFLSKKYGEFDAVISLDVIEHIAPENTDLFISTICSNLKPNGFCVIGTPNKTAAQYSSCESQKGHCNLFLAEELRETFSLSFENVFLFGMNDEVIHTGFEPMCHYLFVLACSLKEEINERNNK
ncbi:MAG: methyltransferase domain-containing protein [bacterium]